MDKMSKTWTDQPDEVAGTPILTSIYMTNIGQSVEVRGDFERSRYITIGNLFGSQTVRAVGSDQVIKILGAIAKLTEGDTLKIEDFPGTVIVGA